MKKILHLIIVLLLFGCASVGNTISKQVTDVNGTYTKYEEFLLVNDDLIKSERISIVTTSRDPKTIEMIFVYSDFRYRDYNQSGFEKFVQIKTDSGIKKINCEFNAQKDINYDKVYFKLSFQLDEELKKDILSSAIFGIQHQSTFCTLSEKSLKALKARFI